MEKNDIHEKDPAFGSDYHSISDRVENNVKDTAPKDTTPKDTAPKGEQVLVLTDSHGDVISTVAADEKITVGLEPADTVHENIKPSSAPTPEEELEDLVKAVDNYILKVGAEPLATGELKTYSGPMPDSEERLWEGTGVLKTYSGPMPMLDSKEREWEEIEKAKSVNEEDEMEEIISEPHENGRPIRVRPLSIGFSLEIGCQSFAIETREKLVKILTAYIMNPKGVEDKYYLAKPEDRCKIFD